ncbi:TetR/AcrR family transcriptional regulator [Streptomyces sp. NPDC047014]|uniref:TetR/AcrR family transcriptional regulator n=1 Tax=Streptomyces sp. NPDC047014 TaxID=3155736 RepID=UPI0033CB5B00
MTTPLRSRRRAVAVQEILDAAHEHVAEHGPGGLALRAVARGLGMTVQALYHYFPSRADLLTALITRAYEELADAVETAIEGAAEAGTDTGTGTGTDRFLAAAEGFRSWAIAHRGLFELLYGTPLRSYAAPTGGGTTDAARRLAPLFVHALYDGLSPEQLDAVDFDPISPALRAHLGGLPPEVLEGLPPPAAALFVSVWAHVHGLIALEAFGHTTFIEPLPDLFRLSVRNLLVDARRRMGLHSA